MDQYGTQILAFLGTVLGGVILAITNRLLDKTKQDRDEARNIREELRKDNETLRQQLADLKKQVDELEAENQAGRRASEAQMVEIHRMRMENTILLERLFKLHELYYNATGETFDTGIDRPRET